MKPRLTVLLAIAMLVLSACSEDNKVGEGVDLNIKDQVNQGLGARTTTTTEAATATSGPQSAAVGRATTTTAPAAAAPTTVAPVATTAAPTTTAARTVPTLEIAINGDAGGQSQFDPSQAHAFAGSLIRWTNKDTQARSIEADDGTFTSPSIAPGESFTYKADRPGKYNYHDGTRPYAVGVLEVLSR